MAEKDNWGPSVFNFFAFGPDHKYRIFPVFLFNFGFRPSIGAHFFLDDAVAKGNNFTTDTGYGGSNWITVGLGDRYNFSKNNWLAVDTRWDRRPDNLFYGIGSEVSDDFKSRWGSDHIEGSWDVTKSGRVLSLGVIAQFADPLGSQPVPFYELVTVGGAEPFTGFLKWRLRDRSAVGAELSWRWPVFAYLDGVAAVGVLNVFDQHLNNFRFDRLRMKGRKRSTPSGLSWNAVSGVARTMSVSNAYSACSRTGPLRAVNTGASMSRMFIRTFRPSRRIRSSPRGLKKSKPSGRISSVNASPVPVRMTTRFSRPLPTQ